MLSYVIGLLIFILPNNAIANIGNEQIELAHYAFTRAIDAGISPVDFLKLIQCESGWNKNALGDYRSETDEYMARGILQYWPQTYFAYSNLYELQGNYMNPYSQINLASKMLSEPEGWKHWYNCWRKIK